MPGCESQQLTAQGWSACCAIAPVHHSLVERLKQRGADLVYRCGKGHAEPLQSDKYSGELVLTPLELINRIAQLVPPPRTHRHRYYGVLAPNSPQWVTKVRCCNVIFIILLVWSALKNGYTN